MMHTRSNPLLPLLGLLVLLATQVRAAPSSESGALLAASDGKGEIRLLWAPPAGFWPAGGWRIGGQDGKVLADVRPLAAEAMEGLDQEEAQIVQALVQGLAGARSAEEFAELRPMLGFQAMSSLARARALGVAAVLAGQPGGARTYSVTGLDASGQATATTLTSLPVDAGAATPLPPAPAGLKAEAHPDGAALFWKPAAAPPEIPVIAYAVERIEKGAKPVAVGPVIMGMKWDSAEPAFTDPLAQVGQELTYTVRSLDAFGRASLPAQASLFMDDPEAMRPPASLTATARPGKVTLAWKPTGNPNTAGYALERASSENGLYELLTPKALDAKATTFTDTGVVDSLIYFYRIRAVNPAGTMGAPSGAVTAMPPNAADPPRPENVRATASPIQVVLEWDRADYPMAGYIVERRSENSTQWNRLNRRATPERTWTDPYAPEAYGTFFYRVIAVSFDNRRSRPSAEVKVSIADLSRPPAPRITSAKAQDGAVRLEFAPGQPESRSTSFLILRGREGQRQGEDLAGKLPAGARSFTDTSVTPGQAYWYTVVALDAAGQESAPCDKRLITAPAPEIPAPAAPRVRLETKPFVHVRAAFTPPPAPLLAALQRRDAPDGPWRTVVRDIGGGEAVDAHPPAEGAVSYRLVFHTGNGLEGPPSPDAALGR